jgi:hypothetical protein
MIPRLALASVARLQVQLLDSSQVRRPKWVLQLLSVLLDHVLVEALVRRTEEYYLLEEEPEESLVSPKACILVLNNNFEINGTTNRAI